MWIWNITLYFVNIFHQFYSCSSYRVCTGFVSFIPKYLIWGHPDVGFPGGSVVKNPPASAGDTSLIPTLGRSLGERNGNPLQYSCLGNLTDRGAWQAAVHRVLKSWMWLSDQRTAVWMVIMYLHFKFHLSIADICKCGWLYISLAVIAF